MSETITVSVLTKDFTAAGSGTIGADAGYSSLTTTHAVAGFVEWKVSLPKAGKWFLHALLTAAESRPCALTVNGVKQADPILGEVTGSWYADRLQWAVYGPYEFKQGDNVLRIDFSTYQPHLKEWGFQEVDESKLRSVLSFGGNGTFVELPEDPFPDPTAFTISLWVRPTVINTGGWHGFLGKQGDAYRKPGLWLCPSEKGIHYDSYSPEGTRYGELIPNFFEKDKWHHITWVKRGSKYEFYKNGELFCEKPAPPIVYTAKSPYWIGRVDNFWIGQIADLSIWRIARSKEEIQKSMRGRLHGEEPWLVGYWPLDQGSGKIAFEKNGRNNHGTITGATWKKFELPFNEPAEPPARVMPVLGTAIQSSVQAKSHIAIPTLAIPADFTLEAWVNPSSVDGEQVIVTKERCGVGTNQFRLGISAGKAYFLMTDSAMAGADLWANAYVLTAPVTVGKWTHLGVTKNGTQFCLYVDGYKKASFNTAKNPSHVNGNPFQIAGRVGPDGGAPDMGFGGLIGEIRIWDLVRSETEILGDMNRPISESHPSYSRLVANYRLDEGKGAVASDAKGKHPGTLVNGPTWVTTFVPITSPKLESVEKALAARSLELEQAKAELQKRSAELDLAKSDLRKGSAELDLAKSDLWKGSTELDLAKSDLRKGSAELDLAKSDLQKRSAELDLARSDLQKGSTELDLAKSDLQKRSAELDLAKSDLQKGSAELDLAKSDLQKGSAELEQAKQALQKSSAELEQLNKAHQGCTTVIEQARRERAQDREASQAEIAQLTAELIRERGKPHKRSHWLIEVLEEILLNCQRR